MKKLLTVMLFALVAGAACKSEIDNKPAATVNEKTEADGAAEEAKEEAPAEASAQEFKEVPIDTKTSKIEWVGAKVTGDHTGGFKDWNGKALVADDGTLKEISFEVDTRSIHSDTEKLTGHLMSDDFFDVEKFPKASFKSTSIEEVEADGSTHNITGDMTIREQTKSITFPATLKVDGKKVAASTEFTLKRFDFGIEYKGKPDDLIKDEVLLKINLDVPREPIVQAAAEKDAPSEEAAQ